MNSFYKKEKIAPLRIEPLSSESSFADIFVNLEDIKNYK